MRCKFYSILLYIILLCLPIQAWAFDKALNQFKNEVSDAIEEYEKEIKKLKKSNLDIAKSLDAANEGDCVLIAGKGHETYQEVQYTAIPFDDRKVAGELLQAKAFA